MKKYKDRLTADVVLICNLVAGRPISPKEMLMIVVNAMDDDNDCDNKLMWQFLVMASQYYKLQDS